MNPTVLCADDPKLAEFERLRDILDTPSEANISMTLRYKANQKLEKLLKEPELKTLLHLSDEQMIQSADAGPVAVINVSKHGCDAIIVQKERKNSIQVVHLDDLHESGIAEYLFRFQLSWVSKQSPGKSSAYIFCSAWDSSA